MEAYIRGIGNISPQHSWGNDLFPSDNLIYEGNRLSCVEPDYKEFITPIQMRRMSRTLKMGVASAGKCLRDAGVQMPDAIIVGTGLGMIADTEKFLRAIIDNGETLLTPTSFIQSTHNTVGAHIAVMIKCNNYNLTYVNDYLSFENALLDSLMRIAENPAEKVLLAGIDEMTDAYFRITDNAGWWKKNIKNNLELYDGHEPGSIAGEGAAFFLVTGEEHPDNYARFAGVRTFYRPASSEETGNWIRAFIRESDMDLEDIDMVITGMNGDTATDEVFMTLKDSVYEGLPIATYKHLCGEYYTASSFASWLGAMALKTQNIPDGLVMLGTRPSGPLRNILIHNQHRNTKHGLILLKAC